MDRKKTINRSDRLKNGLRTKELAGKTARAAMTSLAAMALSLFVPVCAYAGSINGAEQGILNAISEKQEYEGAYYKVTDGYIAKVTEYLSEDGIDMGRQEANDYIAQFHANIGVGIESGYMEKVGDVANAGTGAGDGAGAGTEDSGDDSGEEGGTAAGSDAPAGTGAGTGGGDASGTGAAAAGIGKDPETDGPVVDNTAGSTAEGAVEYMVLPVDEETMYVQGIEELSVHEEAYRDSTIIGTLKEGEPVKITGGATTGWAQVAFGEKTGYVSAAYLRTQGYMDRKEAEKKAEEEARKKAEEEARQAEEAKKAEEEARKAEEAKKAEEEAAAAAEAGQAKDYSDAKPVENSIDLGLAAVVIVAAVAAVLGGVLFFHNKKSRPGKR